MLFQVTVQGSVSPGTLLCGCRQVGVGNLLGCPFHTSEETGLCLDGNTMRGGMRVFGLRWRQGVALNCRCAVMLLEKMSFLAADSFCHIVPALGTRPSQLQLVM